jgi:hypothetical protein
MDFKDSIKQLSERAEKLKSGLQTEEATKNALIMPFIQALGYDVFNPMEVVPEYTCDIGTKKGEKIDYAILKDGEPILLMECKHWNQDLNLHDNQLLRYFHVSKAKFGILTNGLTYKFYTDMDASNKMDERPFLEIDILAAKDGQIEDLKKFHKSYFDIEKILDSAEELRITNDMKGVIKEEFQNPTPEFVKYLAKRIYPGAITARMIDRMTPFVKKSLDQFIDDFVSDTLTSAIKSRQKKDEPEQPEPQSEKAPEEAGSENVVTTEDELTGYAIVKAILYPVVDVERIAYRDAQSYFAILFDDNNRKPVCRLYFNTAKKYIETFNSEKKGTKNPIESLNDIYRFSEEIREIVKTYIG